MRLAVTLREGQVVAAGRLHHMLDEWKAAERVLGYLAQTLPYNTDPDQALLKAAALNQLYQTRVFALHAMARHVASVFSAHPTFDDECSLVERLSRLEASGKEHESFAAKYCHFFVDSAHFPPYDQYARATLRMHLGRGNYCCTTTKQTYRNCYSDLANLRALLDFDPTVRDLDHYLWLRGQWQASGDGKRIGAEAASLFERSTQDNNLRCLLNAMCGNLLSTGV
jgi:hypothetical protein